MKNSILTILAVAALVACKKNETTVIDNSTDSLNMVMPEDNMIVNDSTTMSSTSEKMGSMNDQDQMFADEAARGGMMEVMMGELAAINATNPKVKALGQMMVKDHTAANDELKSWATTLGYSLPTSLDSDKQMKYDNLKAKIGMDFDKAYTDLMVSDHKADIASYKKEASEGAESALKSFASKTVPTLEQHLKSSEEAMNAVK